MASSVNTREIFGCGTSLVMSFKICANQNNHSSKTETILHLADNRHSKIFVDKLMNIVS